MPRIELSLPEGIPGFLGIEIGKGLAGDQLAAVLDDGRFRASSAWLLLVATAGAQRQDGREPDGERANNGCFEGCLGGHAFNARFVRGRSQWAETHTFGWVQPPPCVSQSPTTRDVSETRLCPV